MNEVFRKGERLIGMADTTSPNRRRGDRFWGQGRPSKGPRVPTATVLPRPVWEWALTEAAAYRSCVSQVVADVVSVRAGHPELVQDMNRERVEVDELFASTEVNDADSAACEEGDADEAVDVMTRLPSDVRTWVDDMTEAYDTSLKQIVSDVMCEAAGKSEFVLKMNQPMVMKAEGLPLAI
ncbi:hypothetical protein ACWDTP_34050 [Mycobacterium sp. NPDC003449]